jgi:hypothetical protein
MSWNDPDGDFRDVKDFACLISKYLQVITLPYDVFHYTNFSLLSTINMTQACHLTHATIEGGDP